MKRSRCRNPKGSVLKPEPLDVSTRNPEKGTESELASVTGNSDLANGGKAKAVCQSGRRRS